MYPSPGDLTLVECSDCGTVAVDPGDDPPRHCGRPMRPVDTEDIRIDSPDLDDVLGTVFGMNQTELDICLCVMDVGEATTKQIATDLEVDRSHVSRHLNHLVELGVLEQQDRLLESGGHVHVYTPAPLETVQRNFTALLWAWFDDAVDLVDDLSREKVEAVTDLSDDQEATIFHEINQDDE
jgi:predicted transcriptional regulator